MRIHDVSTVRYEDYSSVSSGDRSCECTPVAWIGLYCKEGAGELRNVVEGPQLDALGAYNARSCGYTGELHRAVVGTSWTRLGIIPREKEVAPVNSLAQG